MASPEKLTLPLKQRHYEAGSNQTARHICCTYHQYNKWQKNYTALFQISITTKIRYLLLCTVWTKFYQVKNELITLTIIQNHDKNICKLIHSQMNEQYVWFFRDISWRSSAVTAVSRSLSRWICRRLLVFYSTQLCCLNSDLAVWYTPSHYDL